MKIISGTLKGRNFYMPKGIRPTPDKVRKAVFDIFGQDMTGVKFIDFFAGSGSVGLEAISRGAEFVYFVEKDIHCANVIEDNLRSLKIVAYDRPQERVFVANADTFVAIKQLNRQAKKFDIAFIDPPYGRDLAKKTLKTLGAYDILHPDCFIIIQHNKREILPESEGRFVVFKQKKYGSSCLTIYKEK